MKMKRFNFDQCGKNFAIGCNLNDHEIDSYNWIVNISFFGFGLISYFFTIVFFWKCFMSYFTVVFYVQFCLGVFYSRCFLSRYFFSMCFIVDTPIFWPIKSIPVFSNLSINLSCRDSYCLSCYCELRCYLLYFLHSYFLLLLFISK